jgi:hypothetical protein
MDLQAIGTYEEKQALVTNAKLNEQSINLGIYINAQIDNISARLTYSLVITNNKADISLGLMQLNELVNRDKLQEDKHRDINVQINKDSYIRDVYIGVGACIYTINL